MTTRRKRGRRYVLRGYRTYVLCGFVRPVRPQRLLWLPTAALVMVVLFSAFALMHTPQPPADAQRELPVASVAHYTAEDFFMSAR